MARRTRALHYLPLALLIAGWAACLALWGIAAGVRQREADARLAATASEVASRLEEFLATRAQVVSYVASHWQTAPVRTREQWMAFTSSVLANFDGIQAINHVRADGVIEWVVPERGNEPALGANLLRHRVVGAALARSAETGEPFVSPPLELIQGGWGFATYFPLRDGDRHAGWVNGVFRVDSVVQSCLQRAAPPAVTCRFVDVASGVTVLEHDMPRSGKPPGAGASHDLTVLDRPWRVTVWPLGAEGGATSGWWANALLVAGLLLVAALSLFARTAVRRRSQADAADRRYRRIVDTTREGVWTVGADGGTTFVNKRMAEMLGLQPEAMAGRALVDFMDETSRATSPLARERSWQAVAAHHDVRFRRADGSVLDAVVSMSPLHDDGTFLGAIAMVADVTERRRLEQRVAQAEKLQAIGRLAGGVAHDFNNLLTAILGAADVLAERLPAGSPDAGLVSEIREAGDRAAQVTRQLLAFARLQVRRPQLVDLMATMRRLEPMLTRLLPESIRLVISGPSTPCAIVADSVQMEQVILNLVLNARDAMPGGGTIHVTIWHEPGPPERVGLSVADAGEGIPDDVRAHLFEPFFTTKTTGHGTGLGLATVQGIVAEAGGDIEVASPPGEGATFRVIFPAADEEARNNGGAREVGELPRSTGAVLLAEDDEAVRRAVRRMLEAAGHEVLEAALPADALEIAQRRRERVDVLLTDLVMPGMNGLELAARITALRPHVGVVFMTGHAEFQGADGGAAALDAPLLRKPFSAADLSEAIRSVQPP